MTSFALSPAAQKDVNEIWDYTTERWGADQAESYIQDIRDTCQGLAAGTRHARPVEIREGYFKCSTGSHFIYFRYADTELQIIRILHKSREPSLHL